MGPKPGTMVNPRIARILVDVHHPNIRVPQINSNTYDTVLHRFFHRFSPMANVARQPGLLLRRLHVQADLKFQLLPKKKNHPFEPPAVLADSTLSFSGIRASLKFEMLEVGK